MRSSPSPSPPPQASPTSANSTASMTRSQSANSIQSTSSLSASNTNNVPLGPPIGIDLGHSYACIALYKNNAVEVIANEAGNRSTPAVIAFTEKEQLYGEAAQAQLASNLTNTVHHIKRLIGLPSCHEHVEQFSAKSPYTFKQSPSLDDINTILPAVEINVRGETQLYSSDDLLTLLLNELKRVVDRYTGASCENCVFAVPPHFDSKRCNALINAAKRTGFSMLHLLNEPIAACIAFGLDIAPPKPISVLQHVVVVDVGGATTTVSLIAVQNGLLSLLHSEVNLHLGGDDFDARMLEHFAKEFERKYSEDLRGSARAMARLQGACERTKRALSTSTNASIELDGLYEGIDFYSSISRVKFEALNIDHFLNIKSLVLSTLKNANVDASAVSNAYMIGGCSRIPKVNDVVKSVFGKEPQKLANPEEAVAIGCALQASVIAGRESEWTELVKDAQKNLHLNKDGSTASSSVSSPAHVSASYLSLSVGVEASNGAFTAVFPKGTVLPAQATFLSNPTAATDNTLFSLTFYEGERSIAKQNHLLGNLAFPAEKSGKMIRVDVKIDAELNVNVKAQQLGAAKAHELSLPSTLSQLSSEELVQYSSPVVEEQTKSEKDASPATNEDKGSVDGGFEPEIEDLD